MMMRSKLMAAVFGATLVFAASCASGDRPVATVSGDCFSTYMTVPISSLAPTAGSSASSLQTISQNCLAASADIQRTSAERANAYFHAGRALVELAHEQEKASAGSSQSFANNSARTSYENAAEALRNATFHNPGLSEAWITLARANAGIGTYEGYYAALVDPTGPLSRVVAPGTLLGLNATYARAEILQRRSQSSFAEPGDRAESVRLLGDVWNQIPTLPVYDASRTGLPETNLLGRNDLRLQTERRIASVAGAMADTALATNGRSLNKLELERARDALLTASRINPRDANTSERLGQTQLYLAGFNGSTASPEFECSAARADTVLASAARTSFSNALANGAGQSALRGRACASQAVGGLDNLGASVVDFRQLVGLSAAPGSAAVGQNGQVTCEPGLTLPAGGDTATRSAQQDLRIDLGRAYKDLAAAQRAAATQRGRTDIPLDARENLGRSICAFESAIQAGTSSAGALQARNARIRFDIANAYLALDDTSRAKQALDAAVIDDPSFADAHFELAKIYLDIANDWRSPDYNAGYEALMKVDRLLSQEGESAAGNIVRANTSYYLSKLQTISGRKGGNTWAQVINYADLALAQYPPELETPWEVEQQTCLARISAGGDYILNDNSARDRCSLNTKRGEPEGLLLRGMYYLKRARVISGLGAKQDNWDSAMLAFDDGLAFMEAPNSTADPNGLLAEKLRMGKLITQYCFGQTSTFQRGVDQSRPYYETAVAFMENHGLDRCR